MSWSSLISFILGIIVGGFFGYVIRFAFDEMKKSKKIEEFLKTKLKAKDYLALKEFRDIYMDDYTPIVLMLKDKLNAVDFQQYLDLAEVKRLQ